MVQRRPHTKFLQNPLHDPADALWFIVSVIGGNTGINSTSLYPQSRSDDCSR
jgi:hypothetical protein